MTYAFTRTGPEIEVIHDTVSNIYNTLGNSNLLSNHNFLIASPDDSQPPPDATPRNYPPGFQIFSGVFANETTGITNLTYVNGHVSFSDGDLYMPVANTGAIARLTAADFSASVADFDGKPRTRGVSFALVGSEYRVTVGVDALEDADGNATPLGSVKFEQGSVATMHSVINLFDIYGDPAVTGVVDVRAFGAFGVGDDTVSLYNAWNYLLTNDYAKTIDFCGLNFNLQGLANYTDNAGRPVYFSTEGVNSLKIKTRGATFFKDTAEYSVIFDFKGSSNISFDHLEAYSTVARQDAGHGGTLLLIEGGTMTGSHDINGGVVKTKNLGSAVFGIGNETDYLANGLTSPHISTNINIDVIHVDNSDRGISFTDDYAGYALHLGFTGKNVKVGKLIADTIHRAIFLYGCDGVQVESAKISETDSTTIIIGSYGSCKNVDIKANINQDTNLTAALCNVIGNEETFPGGGSVDIKGGRTHEISGVNLEISVSGTGNYEAVIRGDKVFSLTSEDSDFLFSNWKFSINEEIAATRCLELFKQARMTNSKNMEVSGILVENCIAKSSSDVNIPPGIIGDILLDNYIGLNVYCTYGDIDNLMPDFSKVRLTDCALQGSITTATHQDVAVDVINSKISMIVSPTNIVVPYNKVFINSYLGGKYIEYKGRFDMYGNIADSSAWYSPDSPIERLAAGKAVATTDQTPLNLDLLGNPDKTAQNVNFYHESFEGTDISASNPLLVKIAARRVGASGYGSVYGRLFGYAVTNNDLTTGTINMVIDHVINSGGQVFQPSDFSVSVIDANTLRFSCSREAGRMYVSIQRF